MDCQVVLRELWDFLDEELTEDRMRQIREHLAICRDCYPQFDFERAFLDAVAAAREDRPAPGSLRRKVLAKLRVAGYLS